MPASRRSTQRLRPRRCGRAARPSELSRPAVAPGAASRAEDEREVGGGLAQSMPASGDGGSIVVDGVPATSLVAAVVRKARRVEPVPAHRASPRPCTVLPVVLPPLPSLFFVGGLRESGKVLLSRREQLEGGGDGLHDVRRSFGVEFDERVHERPHGGVELYRRLGQVVGDGVGLDVTRLVIIFGANGGPVGLGP